MHGRGTKDTCYMQEVWLMSTECMLQTRTALSLVTVSMAFGRGRILWGYVSLSLVVQINLAYGPGSLDDPAP